MKDGLPKLKDFPEELGGTGESLPSSRGRNATRRVGVPTAVAKKGLIITGSNCLAVVMSAIESALHSAGHCHAVRQGDSDRLRGPRR